MKPPVICSRGSLLTYQDRHRERCFGYLFDAPGHGIYEPTFGKLDVSSDEARTHNQLLSQAEIQGLDEHCAIGMGGLFYAKQQQGERVVVTWLGEEVSRAVRIRGQVLTFQRKAMLFRGRLRQQEDAFVFKRIR